MPLSQTERAEALVGRVRDTALHCRQEIDALPEPLRTATLRALRVVHREADAAAAEALAERKQ